MSLLCLDFVSDPLCFPKFLFLRELLDESMAIYSRTLAWRILWTEEPGRLQTMGSHRVGQDWNNLARRMLGATWNSSCNFFPCLYSHLPLVQFSRSVVPDSLRPHEPQHPRPPCPSPTPRVYSNSCPLNQGHHSTISSSLIPFSSHLQSFPASGSFQISQLFASGGQSTGVSASASVLPMNTQDWSP